MFRHLELRTLRRMSLLKALVLLTANVGAFPVVVAPPCIFWVFVLATRSCALIAPGRMMQAVNLGVPLRPSPATALTLIVLTTLFLEFQRLRHLVLLLRLRVKRLRELGRVRASFFVGYLALRRIAVRALLVDRLPIACLLVIVPADQSNPVLSVF